jgi:tetratricopeptide (TPR) repeat protein
MADVRPGPADDCVEDLLSQAVRWLLAEPDPQAFLRRMAAQGPGRFGEMVTEDDALINAEPSRRVHRADAPRFFRSFGWAIASATPLPANDFRPVRLPTPGRNQPCLCGSLRKFKQCCADLIDKVPALDAVYLGALVVEALPAKARATLPQTHIHPHSVLAAADRMRDDGRLAPAAALLEPWARGPAPWKAARGDLLDLLLDLYLDLGKPRKRRQLAEAMVQRGDTVVQSLGWQRLSMMASDAGDGDAAHAAFLRAQRLTPDDPRLALLDVTLLMGSGDLARGRERAAFHARRLARLPHAAELHDEVEAMQALARGDMDHLWEAAGEAGEDDAGRPETELRQVSVFDELAGWAQGLPPPTLRLDLAHATAQDLGELEPSAQARKALADWARVFPLHAPGMAWSRVGDDDAVQVLADTRWVALLRRRPILLDCFDALDALVQVLDVVPLGLAATLQAHCLARGLALWQTLRRQFPQARCEWGWTGNRPALRLLVHRIELDESLHAESSFELLQQLVEVLNPHDNHGLRERLAAVYLRRGQAAQALALAERYPDDFVGMQLLHARALLALQRLPEAERAFADALQANLHVLPLLKAARKPRVPQGSSVAVGSPEQARATVAAQHDLWRDKALRAWIDRRGQGTASLFDS